MNHSRARVAVTIISIALFLPSLAFASFDTDLQFGARGTAVSDLQQFLITRNLLTSGSGTGYFGPLTLAAVKAFQSSEGVQPVSGYFGPLTRAKANALAGTTVLDSNSTAAKIAALLEQVQKLQARLAMLKECADCLSPLPPYVGFFASPMSGPAPLTVTFISSYGAYAIDFGDGTLGNMSAGVASCTSGVICTAPAHANSLTIQHTYMNPGTFIAKLMQTCASDPPGCTPEVRIVIITVTSHIIFSASPASGDAPLTVYFSGALAGNQIDYGDGVISGTIGGGQCSASSLCTQTALLAVSHTYASTGIFTVELSAPVHNDIASTGRPVLGTATITVTGTPAERDARRQSDLSALRTALESYFNAHGTYRITGAGSTVAGIGWIASENTNDYPKAITRALYEAELLSTPILDDPLSRPGYMLYLCDNGASYSLSATLDNPSAADIAHIQTTCNGVGANGTYTRYGKNFAVTNPTH